MIYIVLNLVPIAFACLASMAIGALWLRFRGSPFPSAIALVGIALAQFWCAAILAGALILAPPEASEWIMAIGSAVVICVGFVMPALFVTLLVGEVEWRPILSACAYWLVAMCAQAIVMKGWGLVPPPGV